MEEFLVELSILIADLTKRLVHVSKTEWLLSLLLLCSFVFEFTSKSKQ